MNTALFAFLYLSREIFRWNSYFESLFHFWWSILVSEIVSNSFSNLD